MKQKPDRKHSFSNLANAAAFENMDTSMVDLTKTMIGVIQSGDVQRAREFVESDTYQEYLGQLKKTPDYLSVSYQYNCVAAYISALSVLSAFSGAEKLLSFLTHRKVERKADYAEEMAGTVLAFTALVGKEKRQNTAFGTVRRACAYIQDHLFEKFSLEELASYCGCSLSYLRHRFKQETGLPLVKYIHKSKIEKAEQMLKETTYSVSQISSQLGYCTESYFISAFKKETGVTPGQYKKALV